jgi:hypothetical protein
MRDTFAAFSGSMVNTTTILIHTRALISVLLCQGQNGAQKAQYVDEMSWGTASTITTGSLHLRFLAMDRIFTPYGMLNKLNRLPFDVHVADQRLERWQQDLINLNL